MKTKKLLFILWLISYSSDIIAQETSIEQEVSGQTVFPKRNDISIDVLGGLPILRNLSNVIKVFENGDFVQKRVFILGIRISYLHHTSPTFGFGVEYAFEQTKFQPKSIIYYTDTQRAYLTYEAFDLNSHQLYAKLQWRKTNRKGNIHYNHQLGLGVALSVIPDKSYHFRESVSTSYYDDEQGHHVSSPNTVYIDQSINPHPLFESRTFFGNSLYYSFGVDIRLSEALFLNISVRQALNYTFNTNTKSDYDSPFESEYQISRKHLNSDIFMTRLTSGQTTSIGIKYAF